MINGTCQDQSRCITCNDSGSIKINQDTWKKDKCTNCTCEGSLLKSLLKLIWIYFRWSDTVQYTNL